FTTSCDIAKSFLARNSVNYANEAAPAGAVTHVKIGNKVLVATNAAEVNKAASAGSREAGYPPRVSRSVGYGANVLCPVGAMLVEMFPTRIRYTSMSLPYHIGNGWFGG